MKTQEWKKVKSMLPHCSGCAFMEIKLDATRNYAFHRFCLCAGGKNIIDISGCPQMKF